MELSERIAEKIADNPRLRGVPLAVIEDVIRLGLAWLVNWVPMETRAADLTSADFEACEGCGHLIDFEAPGGAVHDAEGIPLCNACAVEEAGSSRRGEEGGTP